MGWPVATRRDAQSEIPHEETTVLCRKRDCKKRRFNTFLDGKFIITLLCWHESRCAPAQPLPLPLRRWRRAQQPSP